MKTRCPNCQTTFRVTPEQLKARAGKVRCGQCQTVFNALDSLLEEVIPISPGLT
ncbi:MAG: zinc-ribbon domain-containing protein, partial [Betaproteobacteria bacterium]